MYSTRDIENNYRIKTKVINGNRLILTTDSLDRFRVKSILDDKKYNPSYPEIIFINEHDKNINLPGLHNKSYKGTVFRIRDNIQNLYQYKHQLVSLKNQGCYIGLDLNFRDCLINLKLKEIDFCDFIYINGIKKVNDITKIYELLKPLNKDIIISLNYDFHFDRFKINKKSLKEMNNLHILIESKPDYFLQNKKYFNTKITNEILEFLLKETTSNIYIDDALKIMLNPMITLSSQKIFNTSYNYTLYLDFNDKTKAIPFLIVDELTDINNIETMYKKLKENL